MDDRSNCSRVTNGLVSCRAYSQAGKEENGAGEKDQVERYRYELSTNSNRMFPSKLWTLFYDSTN